jgi:hypothetical protein
MSARIIMVISLVAFLGNQTTSAQEEQSFRKFYAGIELGAGGLELSRNQLNEGRTTRFALGIYGGYRPFRWLRAGINLNGWLIEPYNQFFFFYFEEEGISISNIYGQVQVFPLKEQPLFLNFQGGSSKYVNLNPDAQNALGTGGKLGLGYEYPLGRNFGLSLTANWGFGKFGDITFQSVSVTNQHYDVFEVLLGITYR